jgi:hypothetical protein
MHMLPMKLKSISRSLSFTALLVFSLNFSFAQTGAKVIDRIVAQLGEEIIYCLTSKTEDLI